MDETNPIMRILFFIESLRSGGKERRLLELVHYLKFQRSYQLYLVLTENIVDYDYVYSWDVPIYVIERSSLKRDPLLFVKFYKICKNIKPDIIHTWGIMNSVYALPTKYLLKVPLITSMISGAKFELRKFSLQILFYKISCWTSDFILSNSQAGVQAYKLKSDKVHVIYNGINLERFNKTVDQNKLRAELGVTTKYLIIIVASLNAKKNYDLFLDVAKSIQDLRKDISFISVGKGPDLERLQTRIQTERIENVKFLGLRTDVEDLISCSDIGVLFSPSEGFPNSVMEYMALKKPVIVSNVGGIPELVRHDKNGYLVSNDNQEGIVNYIQELCDNKVKREEFGSLGFERILEHHSIETMSQQFIEVYKLSLK